MSAQDLRTLGAWRPMGTAPRDGTMVRLLVSFDEHSTEDSEGPAPTIGANSFDNTGEDEWQFAGWCWTHDHFTEGKGTPVGWLPMLPGLSFEGTSDAALPEQLEAEAESWELQVCEGTANSEAQNRNTHAKRRATLLRSAAHVIRRLAATSQEPSQVTPDMVREAEAHYPFALEEGPTRELRWQWFADYYNRAIAAPNEPCPCCNVTPDGDILDHLPLPQRRTEDDG